MEYTESTREKFWAKVSKPEGADCWIWIGARVNDEYGQMNIAHKRVLAHRISYELKYGSIPTGSLILHHCDVRQCVNPDHLYAGSYSDNIRDRWKRNRASFAKLLAVDRKMVPRKRKPTCGKGHPFTPENTRYKKRGLGFARQCRECEKQRRRSPHFKAWKREYRRKLRNARKAEST
jgi:hypothetical protein